MLIRLDLQSRLPIYEQLKDKIMELVMLEELKAGDQLPSVRTFARELGVNPNTVQKAYQDLEREKVIYSVAGRGSYISSEINLSGRLVSGHINKIKQAVQDAKACGIDRAEVLAAVDAVYHKG